MDEARSAPVEVAPSPELVAAWAALGILRFERVPLWAACWLADGLDGEALGELAGLSGADVQAVRELLPRALAELGAGREGSRRSALLEPAAALDLVRATRTAHDVYSEMLTGHVGPALRRRGLAGSRGRYQLASHDWWALLGFQKTHYSDASSVSFTISLSVVARSTWAAMRASSLYLPQSPSAITYYAEGAAEPTRLGSLVPPAPTSGGV
ncbi:MAG TPA: hypothetical protein VFR07_03080 [Mycobacteriales bacterium]|nr:hypothetical protein [Mycobacteriales bacterium]